MTFEFRADAVVQGNKPYPALAKWNAKPYTPQWRQFVEHWPYTVPNELLDYCNQHAYPYNINGSVVAYYIISIGWFDHDIDYFIMINRPAMAQIRAGTLTVLFYYHEGDNPAKIKQRLDALCEQHELPVTAYKFISANTAADALPGFAYFPSHELVYWARNHSVLPTAIHTNPRPYQFTVLNRTHKSWRATVMTDLHRNGVLDNSMWSYNTNLALGDNPLDNPIQVDVLDLHEDIDKFIANGPYTCDDLSVDQHNDHHLTVAKHFTDSYCNIVIETHFDADQSGGAFLTEKTFKCLKHGQPFVIVGARGSLQALRDLGYRTFDHCIDNSYDLIEDNTQRWQAVFAAIKKLQAQDMHAWFEQCREDLEHNQKLFVAPKTERLNILHDKLLH